MEPTTAATGRATETGREPERRGPVARVRPLASLEWVARNVAAIFLAAVVVVVLIGVIARYIVQVSLPWAEELARLLLVWLTFLGAAAATAKRSHIRVDTIYGRFKEGRARRFLEGIAIVLSILALVILMWASKSLFGPSALAISPGSGIQAIWTRIALPIASVLMILFLVTHLRELLRGRPVVDAEPEEREEV